MPSKGCWGLFLFSLDFESLDKIKKRPGFYTVTETRFINNSRHKQNKKDSTHPSVDFGKTETCAKFQQKILYSAVVGARQSFQFFRQITWFLRNKSGLSKFTYWILHQLRIHYPASISTSDQRCFNVVISTDS